MSAKTGNFRLALENRIAAAPKTRMYVVGALATAGSLLPSWPYGAAGERFSDPAVPLVAEASVVTALVAAAFLFVAYDLAGRGGAISFDRWVRRLELPTLPYAAAEVAASGWEVLRFLVAVTPPLLVGVRIGGFGYDTFGVTAYVLMWGVLSARVAAATLRHALPYRRFLRQLIGLAAVALVLAPITGCAANPAVLVVELIRSGAEPTPPLTLVVLGLPPAFCVLVAALFCAVVALRARTLVGPGTHLRPRQVVGAWNGGSGGRGSRRGRGSNDSEDSGGGRTSSGNKRESAYGRS